jgi:glycosyltransferase involved in cell wall biosynthesis
MIGSAQAPSNADGIPVLIVLPADPERMPIGGIASFIRGFTKFAPADFRFGMIGCSATRGLWRWHSVELEGRALELLPVLRVKDGGRGRIPVALRFTASLLVNIRRLQTAGWILSLHRPATDLAFRRHAGPMWRVVHLGVEDLATPGSESRWRRLPRLLEEMERRSFRRMDRVWIVNEAVADAYRARFPEVADRIRFVPNWVDTTIFSPDGARAADEMTALADLRLGGERPIVLFAGRLEGQKDPLLAARAFAAHRARHRRGQLVVAGDGSLANAMRDELSALGAADGVRFVSILPRDRLAELMRAADVLLITSAFETGPTVGFEALASGLPVVTTPVGEVARVVERTGAGEVVRERTPQALADALESVLREPVDWRRERSVSAAAPYRAERILSELYDFNRELTRDLAHRRSAGGASRRGA